MYQKRKNIFWIFRQHSSSSCRALAFRVDFCRELHKDEGSHSYNFDDRCIAIESNIVLVKAKVNLGHSRHHHRARTMSSARINPSTKDVWHNRSSS
mmetsp:Transcript_10442/g.13593  ORF Transcript_10442/g.13593 Transcript_10442/m.13593 type:complete len:96 (-) Transcript_10442:461-748(-)